MDLKLQLLSRWQPSLENAKDQKVGHVVVFFLSLINPYMVGLNSAILHIGQVVKNGDKKMLRTLMSKAGKTLSSFASHIFYQC